MKKITALLLILLCITLTACQPTPDAPIVESKNDGELEDAVFGTAVPELSNGYEAPETWVETIDYDDDGIPTTINIDATITVPDVKAYPVYRVLANEITQEEANAFIQAMVGDAQLYSVDNPRIKSVIQAEIEKLLQPYEDPNSRMNQALAAGELSQEEYDYYYETDSELVSQLQKEYKTAPAEYQLTELPRAFTRLEGYSRFNVINAVANINDGYANFISVQTEVEEPFGLNQVKNFVSNNSLMEYRLDYAADFYGSSACFNRSWIDKTQNLAGMTISYDEAKAIADSLIYDKLNYSNYSLSRAGAAPYGGAYKDVERYLFIYTPTIDNIPLMFYMVDNIELSSGTADGEYLSVPYPHCVCIYVIDKDNYEVYEQSTLKISDKLNSNVQLLAFDEIQELFKRHIALNVDSSDLLEGSENQDENTTKRTYNITDIRLGYVRIVEKDNVNNGLLVPVWNFYGQQVNTYKDGFDEGWVLNENNEKIFNQDLGNAFLCINAIDGSIINLDKGY